METSFRRLDEEDAKKFRDGFEKLRSFTFKESEIAKNALSLILDEMIAVDPRCSTFEHEFEASELLGHLSKEIPFDHGRLLSKLCQLVVNFCTQNNISLATKDLHAVSECLIGALHQCPAYTYVDILSALAAVCENNTYRLQKFHADLLGGQGVLLHLTDDTTNEEDVVVEAVKCLAALTYIKPYQGDCIEVCYLSACFDTLVHLLHRAPQMQQTSSVHSKMLVYCFTGVQNIMNLKRLPNIELGILFAAVRAYMFFGLTSHPPNIPAQIFPNVVTPFDPLASSKSKMATQPTGFAASKAASASERGKGKEGRAATGDRNRNRRAKKKKGRAGEEDDTEKKMEADGKVEDDTGNVATNGGTESSVFPAWTDSSQDALTWEMNAMKLSSSDSEFSDSEGGMSRRQNSESLRVRHAALICFLNIVRTVEKKVMFGFWSSFLPDCDMSSTTPAQTQSLFTTILKDPAPKCRLAALSSLTSMLESTRPYLAVAEDLTPHHSAFTPFSVVLGNMIKEMHRCLLQAMAAESYKTVLTQVIKCLSNLVNNTPYHRLQPGLLTRVMKQNRHFLNHKDPNVRTAALTCIGAVVGIKPPLMEVSSLIKPPHPPVGVPKTSGGGDSLLYRGEEEPPLPPLLQKDPEVSLRPNGAPPATQDLSASMGAKHDDSVTEHKVPEKEGEAPERIVIENFGEPQRVRTTSLSDGPSGDERSEGSRTPLLGTSGIQTPVFTDQMLQTHASQTSWVIKLCMRSIMEVPPTAQAESREPTGVRFEPLPIRIEGLQVMTSLVKNYFPMMRPSFQLLQNLVQICFEDPNPSIKLHGTKMLEELTLALQKDVQESSSSLTQGVPVDQVFEFWEYFLGGPLSQLFYPYQTLTDDSHAIRAAACECLANIGEEIFAKLPMRRQVQCMTLVLGLTDDEDKLIKASAVRALGVYVMYPTLRTDVQFIMDASQAVLASMSTPSNLVRFKASWALANICDGLVINKQNNLREFMQDFPDSFLHDLLKQAGASVRDSDKVSCNAARAIGNLLRYMPAVCFRHPEMITVIDKAVAGLVKAMSSGTMKVRWNSCYAASNAFQNPHFPMDKPWLTQTLNTLSKVVHTCTNFKVRINATLALTAPPNREFFGSTETFCNVWTCLIVALETAEDINDFAEYKYKDVLVEHICNAVLHQTILIDVSDLSTLSPTVQAKGHTFRTYLEKYIAHLEDKPAPAGIPTVAEVTAHLEGLKVSTDDQRRCQQALVQLFVPDLDTSEEKSPEKINFQQIYD